MSSLAEELFITSDMSSQAIATRLERARESPARLKLDENTSAAQLRSIFDCANLIEDSGALLQLLAAHENSDNTLLEALVNKAEEREDWGTLSAIATRPRSPIHLLQRLRSSEHRFVREHASLALLSHELDSATLKRFRELYEMHCSEGEEDIAARSLIAQHPRTPGDILSKLMTDDVEVVAHAAIRR